MFAIDSNTLITPLGETQNGPSLQRDLRELEAKQRSTFQALASPQVQEEKRDELLDELETLQEELFNLKRLIETSPTVDDDQMLWLQEGLIASHRDPTVRGRILTLHHPPYVT